MSHALLVGVADQIGYFRAYNTDGSAKTDLTSSTTGLALSVFRVGASAVSISSLSAKAADNTAHADGAIRAVSGNLYTVDLPDAACADQVPSISVKGSYTGGVIEGPEHPLVGYNPASVAVGANTTTPPTVGAIADQVWEEATSGHTTAGTYGGRIVRATNSNTEVQITGSNHIAADVHEFQTGVITAGDFAANSITASALATDAVTEIQSGLATAAALATESGKITNIENASGYLLAVLAGACADPQTASETYAITVFGSTFTVDMAGQTSTGTRTAPTLTKT